MRNWFFLVDGVALRAITNPVAWRIAYRRFAAVGLAPGLDFVGRRKTSVSNPSGFAMPPDTKSGLRRTRKRPLRGLHERKERRWEGEKVGR